MAEPRPILFANERGVWREDEPGFPFGIKWEEIASVGGYKLDGITQIYTVVELDFEYGEFLELHADEPGFPQVVRAIAERLPGINPDWFHEIERLNAREPPATVWRRS